MSFQEFPRPPGPEEALVDRVTFTPVQAENGKRTYAFTEELSYGALLPGAIYAEKIALGTPLRRSDF